MRRVSERWSLVRPHTAVPVIEERPQCPARVGWDGERLLWRYRCLGLHHPEFLLRDVTFRVHMGSIPDHL